MLIAAVEKEAVLLWQPSSVELAAVMAARKEGPRSHNEQAKVGSERGMDGGSLPPSSQPLCSLCAYY